MRSCVLYDSSVSDRASQDNSSAEINSQLSLPENNLKPILSEKYGFFHGADTSKIVVGIALGIALGILLTFYKVSKTALEWIELPGKLFLISVDCFIPISVFTSVAISISDLFHAGKASTIGSRLAMLIILTSVVASIQSVLWGVLFQNQFTIRMDRSGRKRTFALQCSNKRYMIANTNGSVSCTSPSSLPLTNTTTFTLQPLSKNYMLDNGVNFADKNSPEIDCEVLNMLIPTNVFKAVVTGDFLSIVAFAIVFGVGIAKAYEYELDRYLHSPMYAFLSFLNIAFGFLIKLTISFSPLAIVSLIGGPFARYEEELSNYDQIIMLRNVGYLIASLACSMLSHLFVVLCPLYFLQIHSSPFSYLNKILPAQLFVLGSASSMGTIPITMQCIDATKTMSRSLTRFGCPITATFNMDGTAMYLCLAVFFVAETSGLEKELDIANMILLIVISTLVSIGTPPIPHAGYFAAITVWKTLMPGSELPQAFVILFAVDWILDRTRSVLNVTVDAILLRILAHSVNDTFEDEQVGDL